MPDNQFQQVKLNDSTFGAYNPATKQAIAFSNPEEFSKYFSSFDPNAPAASFDTSNILASPNRVLSTDQISPQPVINIPTNQANSEGLGQGAVAEAEKQADSLQKYIAEATAPETEADKQQKAILGRIEGLIPETLGRGQAQFQAETVGGIPELKKQLSDLNAQILARSAAYNKVVTDLESTASDQGLYTTGLLSGKQGAILRTKASEIGMLTARAQGLAGNLSAAQSTIDRMVDLRYQDSFDKLTLAKAQLEAIQPLLDKQERIQAQALDRKYADEQRKIQDEKEKAKMNLNFVIQQGVSTPYANISGEVVNTQTGQGWSTEEDFQRDTGMTIDQAYQQGKITDISQQKIQEKTAVSNMMNQFPDAGINLNDSLSSAQAKLQKSRMYQEQFYHPASGGGGITPYQKLTYGNTIQDNMRADPTIKAFGELVNFGVPTVIERFQQGSPSNVSDTILMRTLAKVTDPTTGVREEEYRTFEDAVGAINKVYTLPKKWVGKGRLTDEGRRQMAKEIQDRYAQRKIDYDQSYNYYQQQAGQLGASVPPLYQTSQQQMAGVIGPGNIAGPARQSIPTEQEEQEPHKSFWQKAGNWLWGD